MDKTEKVWTFKAIMKEIKTKEEMCVSEACVFFQWKTTNRLRPMDPIYFFPHYEAHRTEMKLRGMM